MQASCSTTRAQLRSTSRISGAGAVRFAAAKKAPLRATRAARPVQVYDAASIQFIKGYDETCVPSVKLTRSRTGTSGTASFEFGNPSIFEANMGELGEITGMIMVDDEGEMVCTSVSATFINGKPKGINAKYVMKTSGEWDRFMRFMERYSEDNELGFNKK